MLLAVVSVSKRALTFEEAMARGPELARQGHRVHPAQSWVSFFFQTSSILLNFVRGFVAGIVVLSCLGGEPSVRVVFGLGGVGGRARPDARRAPCWTLSCAVPESSS